MNRRCWCGRKVSWFRREIQCRSTCPTHTPRWYDDPDFSPGRWWPFDA